MKRIVRLGYVTVVVVMLVALMVGCAQPAAAPSTTAPKPAATTAPAATSPAQASAPAAQGQPIKIGLLLSYSGQGQYVATLVENGVRAKLDEVGWEIAGRKIELIKEDDAGDPAKGKDKAKKLVEVDKIDVLLGITFGQVAAAVDSYIGPLGIVRINYQTHSKDATKAGENIFLPMGTSESSSAHLGAYAYDKLGYRTATLLFDDYVAGEDYTAGFVKSFEAKGGQVIQTQRSPLGTVDYSPFVSSMKTADVVAIWMIPPELATFYKQYYEFGHKMPVMYTSMSQTPPDVAAVGDRFIDTIGEAAYSPLIDNPVNKQFVKMMQDKYGKAPHHYENGGYISASLFLEAVKANNGDTTPAKTGAAIKKLQLDTPIGKLSIGADRVGIADRYIGKVVKLGDQYEIQVVDTISQQPLEAPWEQ